MRRAWWTSLVLLAWAVAPAGGQEVSLTSGAAELELHGRLHLQVASSSCSEFPVPEGSPCSAEVPAADMFMRRTRLTLDARFNDWIEGRIQPEFGDLDAVELLGAYGRLLFNPAARLTIGHFKRPFDGFQLTSSTRFLTIERDIDIPGVPGLVAASLDEFTTAFRLSAWDVGVMLDGVSADDRFQYWLGVFNGRASDENGDLNTEKQVVGRGRLNLEAAGEPLALAAAVALTDVPFTRPTGELAGKYFRAFELWAELGSFDAGPHVQAGLVFGQNPLQNDAGGALDLAAEEAFADFVAWQVIGSYRFPVADGFLAEGVEPVFRITRADPNTALDDDASWGLTPGVQVLFAGRNRVAANWDLAAFEADALDSEHSFKVQYYFYF